MVETPRCSPMVGPLASIAELDPTCRLRCGFVSWPFGASALLGSETQMTLVAKSH